LVEIKHTAFNGSGGCCTTTVDAELEHCEPSVVAGVVTLELPLGPSTQSAPVNKLYFKTLLANTVINVKRTDDHKIINNLSPIFNIFS
jgi:hypothetical protein